jgi:hypothetical protein
LWKTESVHTDDGHDCLALDMACDD